MAYPATNNNVLPKWVQFMLMMLLSVVVGTLCAVALLVTLWLIGVI